MLVFRLAIIGGGPSCTYVSERLTATAPQTRKPFRLEIHIFERSGEFGSGEIHSPRQPASSFLNRIAGQVGFAADETVEGAGPLLPRASRPTLYEWCKARFAETGEDQFALEPESWPQRRVHGLALQDAFRRYMELLSANPAVRVFLHSAEVIDLERRGDEIYLAVPGWGFGQFPMHHVLFLTGHSHADPALVPSLRRLLELAAIGRSTYVPYMLTHSNEFLLTPSGPGRSLEPSAWDSQPWT